MILYVFLYVVGCILAELLGMQVENVSDPNERVPLFPGKTCFPLSVDASDASYNNAISLNDLKSSAIGSSNNTNNTNNSNNSNNSNSMGTTGSDGSYMSLDTPPVTSINSSTRKDQLDVIFEVIGTPTHEDVEVITGKDLKAKKYIMEQTIHKPKVCVLVCISIYIDI